MYNLIEKLRKVAFHRHCLIIGTITIILGVCRLIFPIEYVPLNYVYECWTGILLGMVMWPYRVKIFYAGVACLILLYAEITPYFWIGTIAGIGIQEEQMQDNVSKYNYTEFICILLVIIAVVEILIRNF